MRLRLGDRALKQKSEKGLAQEKAKVAVFDRFLSPELADFGFLAPAGFPKGDVADDRLATGLRH